MDQETAERIRQGWRAELGAPAAFLTLLASRRIARSLGFEELGRQATYKLALPP
jgi:hypothetical protein